MKGYSIHCSLNHWQKHIVHRVISDLKPILKLWNLRYAYAFFYLQNHHRCILVWISFFTFYPSISRHDRKRVWLHELTQNLEEFEHNHWLVITGGVWSVCSSLTSWISSISTLRFIFFLIFIATSEGLNLPHTLTLHCCFSTKCFSISSVRN